ncbi:MAG: hypothetical protein OXM61_11750 [Candidatus Poribacteria bacterium]|nr:hypothetical protein [Candidatus Poribacteria bacterium]
MMTYRNDSSSSFSFRLLVISVQLRNFFADSRRLIADGYLAEDY